MAPSIRSLGILVLGLTILAFLSSEADAQMRRSPFGTSRVSLATLRPVQEELKLNDEQKGLADALHDQLTEDRREVFQSGGGNWDAMRKEVEKLDAEATTKFNEKIDDHQKRRLTEIYVQANGPNALADSAVIEILELTNEQQEKLEDVRQSNREDMFDAFQDFPGMNDEERRETMDKLRNDADDRLLDALTEEQRDGFAKLRGAEIEYDLSELRGGSPSRAGGGRGGRRGTDNSRPQRPQ